MTAAHATEGDGSEHLAPELVAPLVSALVSAGSRVNGEVLVTGGGRVRRSATVECEPLLEVSRLDATDASAQRSFTPLHIEGSCREFRNALESYADFRSRVVGGLRQP